MSQIHGVIVVARNGDRMEYFQDPNTYNAEFTETTALGEVSMEIVAVLFTRFTTFTGPIIPTRVPAEVNLSQCQLAVLYCRHAHQSG
jgi:hypothetical protein